MTTKWERMAAAFVALSVVTLTLAGFVWLPVVMPEETIPARLIAVVFAVVGAIATRKREGRTIGWLMIGIGVSSALLDTGFAYSELWAREPERWPLGEWAWALADTMGQISTVLMFVFLPLLFPSGRPAGVRWRRIFWIATGLGLVSSVGVLLSPDEYEYPEGVVIGSNPLGVMDADLVGPAVTASAIGLLILAVMSIVGFMLRFRRSEGLERLQMKWLAAGLGATLTMFLVILVIGGLAMLTDGRVDVPEVVIDLSFGSAILFVPLGAGMAVTRYRLYDIDRVISRTAAYSVVVLTLATIYVGAILLLGAVAQAAAGDEANDLVVALSTLLVAALFQPVRGRVQAVVERRFNRRRYDASQEVERFGSRLRDSLALEDVVGETVAVAGRTLQPEGASLWLREGGAV